LKSGWNLSKMHEMSIAHAILTEAEKIAQENNAQKVIWVRVKIGVMTGVVTEQLQSAFEIYKLQFEACGELELIIHEQPLVLQCKSCGKRTQTTEYVLQCEHCHSMEVDIIDGDSMFIEQLELDLKDDIKSGKGSA